MLDNLDDLVKLLSETQVKDGFSILVKGGAKRVADQMYCPSCGDTRRMLIAVLSTPQMRNEKRKINWEKPILQQIIPSLLAFRCVQCDATSTVIIYRGPTGPALAILPSHPGGLSASHTPAGVAYYLDQAHKSRSVTANSAAVSMYRGALEHLLFEQGYKDGMLGQKISTLLDGIRKGTAPKWAQELDTDFLDMLKDLGNAAIHPNDGNVTKQAELDSELLSQMNETFRMLLFLVYEAPRKKHDLKTALRAKAQVLKK